MNCEAVVFGSSAGGMEALRKVLSSLPEKYLIPIIVVQHLNPNSESYLAEYLSRYCNLKVKEVEEKERLEKGWIYVSPPNYHTLIEKDGSFTLTVEERVSYARPSIDVLFESAADAFGQRLAGIILTGANSDGSYGLMKIKKNGGIAIVQDPDTAEAGIMPRAALERVAADYVLNLESIGQLLIDLQYSGLER